MTRRQAQVWSWSAISFVVVAAAVGAIVERATHRIAAQVESRFGYQPDPAGLRRVMEEFGPAGRFATAGADAIEKAVGRDTFLYRPANKAHVAVYGEPWVVGKQGIGDCVSWGWSHAIWVALCCDWETGRLANPPPMVATESVYGGSRVEGRGRPGDGRSAVGGYSDGSYGAAAARFVRDWGVIFREEVGGHDLRIYSPTRAKSWGAYGNGGQGDGGRLDELARLHPAEHVAAIGTFDEAAAAIESGFPIAVCSSQGFSSVRGADAFAEASGSWAHCMVFLAVRYRANGSPEDGLLCLNSWGPAWNSGGVWPADMPAGSFWVRRSVVDRMLGGESSDSFAVGSVGGLGHRPINHGDWLEPAAVASYSLAP
ncbi:hypothetical protein UFOVP1124_26 [uncultured Caudovirales phage]|uniref:Uncharacterized protein n=1 Tax=uncultured Caudovirales phage TaxID=2100421 RepID=A0A6J5QLL6_9CAUD|nr:hypothetical protein UFOVP1124_26 [uncultured Caudovirales phage]